MTGECTIVIPVFNALHVVRPCVASVLRWTALDDNRVLIVNDGSDTYTSEVLRSLAEVHLSVNVLENPRNLGFVRSCNRAFSVCDTEFVLLLNSDTCVTPRWLDKMVACMSGDRSIAAASPISNTAPHLSIPMLPGWDYLGMNEAIESISERRYPDVTTPEGYCLILRSSILDEIGTFDPVFDYGYGEESDLSMRANYFGYRTVCVDDTYIYHRGRATFGPERRKALYEQGRQIFNDRWGVLYEAQFSEHMKPDPLGDLRDALASLAGTLESAFRR